MNDLMRAGARCVRPLLVLALIAPPARAQLPRAEQVKIAISDLGPTFAQELALRNGWFRGQQVRYWDFGPFDPTPSDVYWPIHGFALDGSPVPLRGQAPIFATLPGFRDYSTLWRLHYLVVADHAKPNRIKSVADVRAMQRSNRATIVSTKTVLNLPIVARGSRLEGKPDEPPREGWFEGHAVPYFDFGVESLSAAPIFPMFRPTPPDADPVMVEGQRNVIDVVPTGDSASVDLWDVHRVRVDSGYVANAIKGLSDLRAAESRGTIRVVKANQIRNCPVWTVDGKPVPRLASPLERFAIR